MNVISERLAGNHHLVIRVPTVDDVEELAISMRHADEVELRRATGEDAAGTLRVAVERSSYVRCAIIDDRVMAIWGIVPWRSILARSGSPWCITSYVVEDHPLVARMLSMFYLEEMIEICPDLLFVQVDAQHEVAVRWMKWLGFELHTTYVNDYPFYDASISTTRRAA